MNISLMWVSVVKMIIEFLVTLMALPPEYVPQHEPLAGRQIRAFLLALFKNIGAYLLNKITQDEFLDNFRRLRYLLERPTHYTLGNEEDYFNQVIIALLDPDKLYDLGYRSDRVICKNFAIRLANEAWEHPQFLEFIHDVARKDRLEKAGENPDWIYDSPDIITDVYAEFPAPKSFPL
jgi:hypothetical protein